ncbi:MAG: NAAT family transporter [Bacteroidetes bacterium]|nr:NAAT family transporter [Bacteroidota bacterium]
MLILDTLFTFKTAFFLSSFVTLLALINPIQKIFVINSLQEQMNDSELRYLSIKSSITAFIILVIFLVFGNIIFGYIFRIQLYSFRVMCGFVLVYSGWIALHKGVLINIGKDVSVKDISSVPIAIPMIAGPGTITATVTFPAQYGSLVTILAIFGALGVNLIIMLYAKNIGRLLIKLNVMSALVRIIGLIIATIGIQMIFDGGIEFLKMHGLIKLM